MNSLLSVSFIIFKDFRFVGDPAGFTKKVNV